MDSECTVNVRFYQDDEDDELLDKCVKKIKNFYSEELGWEWNKKECAEGYEAETECTGTVGDIFDDEDGTKMLKIMHKYNVWSSWIGLNYQNLTCSYVETDLDGFVGENRSFSLVEVLSNKDEEGSDIDYTKNDFEAFLKNIKSELKAQKSSEIKYFDNIFKTKGEVYLKLKEAFDSNYSNASDLHDALYNWIETYIYKDWIG